MCLFVFVCAYYALLIICCELIFTACYDMDQQRLFLLWEDPGATENPSSPQESLRILYPAKMRRTAEWVHVRCKPLQINHCCVSLSTSSWGTDLYPYFFSVYEAEVMEWAVWTYTDVLFPTSSSKPLMTAPFILPHKQIKMSAFRNVPCT